MNEYTFGIEEEYHLVDVSTLELSPSAPMALQGLSPGQTLLQPELLRSQLEVATSICSTLDEARDELLSLRLSCESAARAVGCRILPSGTHPFSLWRNEVLSSGERYQAIAERFGVLTRQQVVAGCHVHVSMEDLDLAVEVMNRARPWLPVLLAIGANSPFFEGTDTSYASFRSQWFTHVPTAGMPPVLGSYREYEKLVETLVSAGMVDDASFLYWDLRPSLRFPTIEFRVSDVCTTLDEAVLQAALARSLVRTLVGEVKQGLPAPNLSAELAAAARWRAARFGMEGSLLDPLTFLPVPAPQVVWRLLRLLRPDLEEHEEWAEVSFLVAAALTWGTGSVRQRERLLASGALRDVVLGTAEEGLQASLPALQKS